MKKILFITTNLDYGGSERRCTTLSLELQKMGYEVSVLCLFQKSVGAFKELLVNSGVEVITAPNRNILSMTMYVRRMITERCYEAVISILYYPNMVNCLAAIGKHKWNVIVGEPSAFVKSQEKGRMLFGKKRDIMMKLYRFSDYILCNSYNAQSNMLEQYPHYKEKVRVIYNPVNITKPTTAYKPLSDGKLHICVAASIKQVKNPLNVARAMSLLEEKDKRRVVLEWYGSNQSEGTYSELQDIIHNNFIEDSFVLHPATKDISEKMNQADCIGLFSVAEGLPNAICEGMVLGKPIVMSRCSDYDNLVKENGTLCDWDDVESIKDAILFMMNKTPEELKTMGNKSRERANELLDKNKIIKQWINTIETK